LLLLCSVGAAAQDADERFSPANLFFRDEEFTPNAWWYRRTLSPQ